MSRAKRPLLYALVAYTCLVVYGSLVPFELRGTSLSEALQAFANIRYLQLGVTSRADWIANILLYIPLAFLASAWLGRAWILRGTVVFIACALMVIGVEFTQIFFKPRTVSINDIVAELIGTGAGIVLWQSSGGRLRLLWATISAGRAQTLRAAMVLYGAAYVLFSLFPYDFLISPAEIAWKLESGRDHLLMAPGQCAGLVRCIAKLLSEIAAVVPFGVFVGAILWPSARHPLRVAVLGGILLGATIETLQVFTASGAGQGISVLTRTLGMVAGAWLAGHFHPERVAGVLGWLRKRLKLIAAPYLLLLMALNDWFSAGWLSLGDGLARISDLHFLPLYYHYYTSEAVAFVSLVSNLVMYAPIGIGYWLWTAGKAGHESSGGSVSAAWYGAPICFLIEFGKLFLVGKHPDPTNVLLAAGASAIGFALVAWLVPRLSGLQQVPMSELATAAPGSTAGIPNSGIGLVVRRIFGSLLLIAAGAAALNYPVAAMGLLAALVIYGAVLARFPAAWLFVIPALLPVLDLAPWTGWFFLDELDLFVLATLGVYLWRGAQPAGELDLPRPLFILVALFSVSWLVSAVIGVVPLQPLDANAFSNYYSHYNSLRVAKGLVWAMALMPLVLRDYRGGEIGRYFLPGMLAGMVGVLLVVLWERHAFPGLMQFEDYRIKASFSSMHTGGAHVEAYLALGIPFIVGWALLRRSAAAYVAGVLLFGLGTYAMMVTFSRAGYLAYASSCLILILGVFVNACRKRADRGRNWLVGVSLLMVAVAVAIPVFGGGFIMARFAQAGQDLGSRMSHWRQVLDMREQDGWTSMFGMGLGRFPETYFWRNPLGTVVATYRYVQEGDNVFLRLGAGDSLYMKQRVAMKPKSEYLLSIDVRGESEKARLSVPICEQHLLDSYRCRWLGMELKAKNGAWEHHELRFNSGDVGKAPWHAPRPVALALYNPGGVFVDVDNVRLLDEVGRNIIANGDFSKGADRWFFSTDNHLPWHIKNLWVQVLFDQGWFGVVVFDLLFLWVLLRVAKCAWRGDIGSAALLSSLVGFLTVGAFGSLFDAPRLTLIFFLVLLIAALHNPQPVVRDLLRTTARSSSGPARYGDSPKQDM